LLKQGICHKIAGKNQTLNSSTGSEFLFKSGTPQEGKTRNYTPSFELSQIDLCLVVFHINFFFLMESSSHTVNEKNYANIIGSGTLNLCNDQSETETLLTKNAKR
jgi:hypothetical protein